MDRTAGGQGSAAAGGHAHSHGADPVSAEDQIHALLADRGLHPEGSDIFAGELNRLCEQLPAVTRERAQANLRLIEGLDKEIDLADGQIHQLFAHDAAVRRLLPFPASA